MISQMNLKNFKCFGSQNINLSNLTLLTGINGCGKSSVIQSLLALRQSNERDLLEEFGLSLNGELVNLGKASDVLFEDAQEDAIEISLSNNSVTSKWVFDYHSEADVIRISKEKSIISPEIYTESLFNGNFQYITAERLGPRVTYQTSDFSVGQQRRIGIRGEFSAHYLALFGDDEVTNKRTNHERASSNQLKGQLEAWLSEVSPKTQVSITHHKGMDLVNIEYSFVHGTSVTKKFRSTNVGFGITYTLPVLVAVLSAKPGDTLIIENPEAHLHPQGQRKLGELFALAADGGVQIITESHSDHFLNGIRIAINKLNVDPKRVQINYFSADRNKESKSPILTSPKIDSSGRLDSWPDGFFDEWDKSLEMLLV